jgi:hypothetical protein
MKKSKAAPAPAPVPIPVEVMEIEAGGATARFQIWYAPGSWRSLFATAPGAPDVVVAQHEQRNYLRAVLRKHMLLNDAPGIVEEVVVAKCSGARRQRVEITTAQQRRVSVFDAAAGTFDPWVTEDNPWSTKTSSRYAVYEVPYTPERMRKVAAYQAAREKVGEVFDAALFHAVRGRKRGRDVISGPRLDRLNLPRALTTAAAAKGLAAAAEARKALR